jgi:hypothetical protein
VAPTCCVNHLQKRDQSTTPDVKHVVPSR